MSRLPRDQSFARLIDTESSAAVVHHRAEVVRQPQRVDVLVSLQEVAHVRRKDEVGLDLQKDMRIKCGTLHTTLLSTARQSPCRSLSLRSALLVLLGPDAVTRTCLDVGLGVGAALLVPHADGMAYFVLDDSGLQTNSDTGNCQDDAGVSDLDAVFTDRYALPAAISSNH